MYRCIVSTILVICSHKYLNNFIGYHAVTWHSIKFDIVWLKLVLTWFHFRFLTKSIKRIAWILFLFESIITKQINNSIYIYIICESIEANMVYCGDLWRDKWEMIIYTCNYIPVFNILQFFLNFWLSIVHCHWLMLKCIHIKRTNNIQTQNI
jgi:hypothetical protein